MTEWLLVLLSVGLILACGGFVAAEFAFVTVDRASVERAAAAGDKRSAGTLAALKTLSTQLSGAQLGITVTNLAIGFLAEPAIARLIDGPLERAGLSSDAATGVSVTLALVLATALTMVFGELVPKNLAIARPLQTARWVQGFQRGFTKATAWPIRFLNGTANAILRAVGIEPSEELASARSPQELVSLVARSAQQGTLESSTATLVQRSLAFGERRARDVLRPQPQVLSVDADSPVSHVLELASRNGHSRFPVTDPDAPRDVVGVVHVRNAVSVPFSERDRVRVRDVAQPAVFIPESMELDALLEVLKEGHMQLAVVLDEFGAVDGIVTLEDLIEEIVGDVVDEHDDEPELSRRGEDGTWVLSALLRPDEASRILGTTIAADEEYETLGGLVTVELGRLPAEGDAVTVETTVPEHLPLPADGDAEPATRWRLTVLGMDGHRVDQLRAEPDPEPSADHPEVAP